MRFRCESGPARNMNYLEWDSELAEMSHRWIRQCINGTDPCPISVYSDGQYIPQRVGENGYERSSWYFPKKMFTSDIVYLWYKEVKGSPDYRHLFSCHKICLFIFC